MGDYSLIFLTHAVEQNVINASQQIDVNCNFPNGRGTDRWSAIHYNEELEVFYIIKPPVEGWSDGVESFTQEQMMQGVVDVIEQDWE